jgi:NTE family protein
MASTCLPTLFRAVEIDGAYYWDGGYMGNPALNPLVDCADDLLTVLIDPLDVAGEPPKNPRQIVNRINEVSFNSSWVWEMRQIELINQLLNKGFLQGSKYTPKRFHLIRNDRFMESIGAASRDFVYELRDIGRECADKWVSMYLKDVGTKSSLDVEKEVALRLRG